VNQSGVKCSEPIFISGHVRADTPSSTGKSAAGDGPADLALGAFSKVR
jgi:hypothetical protein